MAQYFLLFCNFTVTLLKRDGNITDIAIDFTHEVFCVVQYDDTFRNEKIP